MKILKSFNMKEHSNMKIGGIAKEFIVIENKDEIQEALELGHNIFVIGNGTNTLLNDGELNRTFISLKSIDYIKDFKNGLVEVGAGLDFDKVIEYMEKNDYSGLENLAGIPGSVGGLVFMNGGAYGTEIFDCIEEIEIVDENFVTRRIKKSEMNFTYRKTEIKEKGWIVLSTTFKFEKGYNRELVEEHREQRRTRHPLTEPNLGSTFKNPKGNFSARLIIEAGLQGATIGGAQVSTVHPNFIVNKGTAKFEDILELIDLVKTKVQEKSGILLEEEIIIVRG
ncbi:MAG: UDP-N-acetylmuramate dehydrogenase [Cetobacterium sp.]|uniref:UDP-N-acetylmuramate dehydrogenase n=1 Tax=unclassified Cetobacterium TaxID=2630983 RepID=UPI00163BB8EA|nr:UDP-N-acetylmuramate dehydrogenase [Cetobacterium sp. 2A]MBC2856114.1 UDP-N-acetylmuramate dehydrogenase [Cetobacterium sp. 2A]